MQSLHERENGFVNSMAEGLGRDSAYEFLVVRKRRRYSRPCALRSGTVGSSSSSGAGPLMGRAADMVRASLSGAGSADVGLTTPDATRGLTLVDETTVSYTHLTLPTKA